jgi:ribosomal protein S6E (S10)
MQSFHQSRGKICFEVFCALAASASCVGAWMQTGAWALLGVASVAALYGICHAFELGARRPATAVDSVDSGVTIGSQSNGASDGDEYAAVPLAMTGGQSTTEITIEKAVPAEPGNRSPATKRPRAKTGRNSGSRRTKGAKETKVTELAPPVEFETNTAIAAAEEAHLPPVPLFEPQPLMRQQRAVFGRKGDAFTG